MPFMHGNASMHACMGSPPGGFKIGEVYYPSAMLTAADVGRQIRMLLCQRQEIWLCIAVRTADCECLRHMRHTIAQEERTCLNVTGCRTLQDSCLLNTEWGIWRIKTAIGDTGTLLR